jgi:hypothetical protein
MIWNSSDVDGVIEVAGRQQDGSWRRVIDQSALRP